LVLWEVDLGDDLFGLLYLSLEDHLHWAVGYEYDERGYQDGEKPIESQENSKAILKPC
jgi:hypothetical protein